VLGTDGTIIAAGGAKLFGVSVATCAVSWSFPTDDLYISTSPTVDKGIAYFGAQNTLYAVDTLAEDMSTALVWSYASTDLNDVIYTTPAVYNGTVYVALYNTNSIISVKDGVLVLDLPIDYQIKGSLTFDGNGILYAVLESGFMLSLNLDPLETVTGWVFYDSSVSSPAIFNGTVYITDYSCLSAIGERMRVQQMVWMKEHIIRRSS
jgi:hypothetical protein